MFDLLRAHTKRFVHGRTETHLDPREPISNEVMIDLSSHRMEN